MEQIFNDTLGNVITVRYDAETNVVTVNNNAIDSVYYEIVRCNEDVEPHVICIDSISEWSIWESWSDVETRLKVGEFFWANKVI